MRDLGSLGSAFIFPAVWNRSNLTLSIINNDLLEIYWSFKDTAPDCDTVGHLLMEMSIAACNILLIIWCCNKNVDRCKPVIRSLVRENESISTSAILSWRVCVKATCTWALNQTFPNRCPLKLDQKTKQKMVWNLYIWPTWWARIVFIYSWKGACLVPDTKMTNHDSNYHYQGALNELLRTGRIKLSAC